MLYYMFDYVYMCDVSLMIVKLELKCIRRSVRKVIQINIKLTMCDLDIGNMDLKVISK